MLKIVSIIVLVFFLTWVLISNLRLSEGTLSLANGESGELTMFSKLDGAYELVSETLRFDEPIKRIERRTSNEWLGFWFFQKGHFSETLMKKRRSDWTSALPRTPDVLGFDNITGTYVVHGDRIELEIKMALYPEEVGRPTTLKVLMEGETLTLIENLPATKESLVRGERITILRRIR